MLVSHTTMKIANHIMTGRLEGVPMIDGGTELRSKPSYLLRASSAGKRNLLNDSPISRNTLVKLLAGCQLEEQMPEKWHEHTARTAPMMRAQSDQLVISSTPLSRGPSQRTDERFLLSAASPAPANWQEQEIWHKTFGASGSKVITCSSTYPPSTGGVARALSLRGPEIINTAKG